MLTARWLETHKELWERMVTHPFVEELGKGTLSKGVFARYFRQDYLFVKALQKVLAIAITKASSTEASKKLGKFLGLLLGSEDDLFKGAFREMGLTEDEMAKIEALPTCLSFTSYLLRTAYEGDFHEILSELYCVEGSYLDWAQRLKRSGASPGDPAYEGWIEIHTGDELQDFVHWLKASLNTAPGLDEGKLEQIFISCLRYEYRFWEMSYRGEEWP